MSIVEEIFSNKKKAVPKKLKEYGFKKIGDTYAYSKKIFDGQFTFKFEVSKNGVSAKLIEEAFGEEFKLHLVSDSQGSFISGVRNEFENRLKDIAKNCFENSNFENPKTIKVIEFIKKKYGTSPEFPWKKYPNFAVFRHSNTSKWYAVLMVLKKDKLGLDSYEDCEVINLRSTPDMIEKIIDSKNYFNAYHMNKKYWISVLLNGDIVDKEIREAISQSYKLTSKSKR